MRQRRFLLMSSSTKIKFFSGRAREARNKRNAFSIRGYRLHKLFYRSDDTDFSGSAWREKRLAFYNYLGSCDYFSFLCPFFFIRYENNEARFNESFDYSGGGWNFLFHRPFGQKLVGDFDLGLDTAR